MTVQVSHISPSVSTPTPVHSHTELDAVEHVKWWAVRHETTYTETLADFEYFKAKIWNGTPWQIALFAAAESLAGAERIAQAVAYAGWHQQPNHVSTSGGVTRYSYKFAPSSHKSKRVKHCKLCEKQGKLCHIHAKRQAVAA